MIAKVIAHGTSRDQALDRLAGALDDTVVAGPRTNAGFLAALARAPDFRAGRFDTGFIDARLQELGAVPQPVDRGAVAQGATRLVQQRSGTIAARSDPELPASPWDVPDAFQLTGMRALDLALTVDGKPATAQVGYGADGATVTFEGASPDAAARTIDTEDAVYVLHKGRQTVVRLRDFDSIDVDHAGADGLVRAPMHGKVLALLVERGQKVGKGHRVAVVEAMKMEHALAAPLDGVVSDIAVTVGAQVAEGAKVMLIKPDKEKD
jgi:3-methylcrotonyl-CoA carboxylase alpha subunit